MVLHSQQAGEDGEQDGRAGHVAQVERHRQQVARGLAEGGGGYLHHPEAKGDRRHFAPAGDAVAGGVGVWSEPGLAAVSVRRAFSRGTRYAAASTRDRETGNGRFDSIVCVGSGSAGVVRAGSQCQRGPAGRHVFQRLPARRVGRSSWPGGVVCQRGRWRLRIGPALRGRSHRAGADAGQATRA
ncbi:hypothetical protein G6F23_013352 [Rhizopus arrhizus]|nr:hypothetical protein G6F23_013352 [Rhizopus arrhizus]